MIQNNEIQAWSEKLGVPEDQIAHDHVVSHLLVALGDIPGQVFFGGTALNRTHLGYARLSEDIDVYVTNPGIRASDIAAALAASSRREYPGMLASDPIRTSDVSTIYLTQSQLSIKLQVVQVRHEHEYFPTERASVALRYSDLEGSVVLTVPTITCFAAMKLGAFADRGQARDLFDLAGLVRIGAIDDVACALLRDVRGSVPQRFEFADDRVPPAEEWRSELANQVADTGDPMRMIRAIRDAIWRA